MKVEWNLIEERESFLQQPVTWSSQICELYQVLSDRLELETIHKFVCFGSNAPVVFHNRLQTERVENLAGPSDRLLQEPVILLRQIPRISQNLAVKYKVILFITIQSNDFEDYISKYVSPLHPFHLLY